MDLTLFNSKIEPYDFCEQIDQILLLGVKEYRKELPFSINKVEREYLLGIARTQLNSLLANSNNFNTHDVPTVLKIDSSLILFISLYDREKLLICLSTNENSLFNSVKSGINFAANLLKENQPIEISDIRIEISILFDMKKFQLNEMNKIEEQFEIGIHSIGFISNKKITILKNNVALKNGLNYENFYKLLMLKSNITNEINPKNTSLLIFKTLEFREDYSNYTLYDLFRGRPLLLQSEITLDFLVEAVNLSLHYLENFISQNIFNYEYCPQTYQITVGNLNEEILRCLGSFSVMGSACHLLQKEDLLFLLTHSFSQIDELYFNKEDSGNCLNINNVVDLGSNGFFLLLAKQLNKREHVVALQNLILSSYDPAENKLVPFLPHSSSTKHHESEYYFPGIALFALSEPYDNKSYMTFIEIAAKVFPYYQSLYLNTENGLKMAVWMSAVYRRLFEMTHCGIYKDFVYRLCDDFLELQLIKSQYPDTLGCFNSSQIVTTAVAIETILEGYKLAKQDDITLAKRYKKSALLGLRFILQYQYNNENCFNKKAIGGFCNSLTDVKIRIDTVQHCLSAILKSFCLFD